jgi:hypothetical protein
MLIIIIKIILSLRLYAPFIYLDEFIYDSLAQNLLTGKLYAKIGGSYPPGYPFFLSFAYLFSDDKSTIYHLMVVISTIFTTSIIFPSYFLLKRYCSIGISIPGSLAITTLPFLNYYSFTIMTEALFIPLFLYSIWFLIKSFETNEKKWEFLTSLSIVYLFITRSNGLAMIIAFILTFIYYLIANSSNNKLLDLIRKKSFLLASFIILLSTWLIISTYITDINYLINTKKPITSPVSSNFYYGSSYNTVTIITNLLDIFSSLQNFLDGLKLLIINIDYLLITSYFFILIIIYYIIYFYLNKKIIVNNTFLISLIYYLITTLLLIFSTITYSNFTGEKILGRYIEPVIPFTIILGIISINKISISLLSAKKIYYFCVSFIVNLLITLFTFIIDDMIILGFGSYINNPMLFPFRIFFTMFYGSHYGLPILQHTLYILPLLLIFLYFLFISR